MPRKTTPRPERFARAVSAEIRALLGRRNLTQRQLAEQIGKSDNYVSMRLTDKAPFDLNDLSRLCAALNLDMHDLIARANEAARTEPE